MLSDIITDAKTYPTGWKAVFGKDYERCSTDYYVFNSNIGIYLLKEYQKNPFEIKGVGGKIARYIDDDIEQKMSRYPSDFGIIHGDIKQILQNIEKGIPPQQIVDAAVKRKGKNLGISIPVRGHASAAEDSFNHLHDTFKTRQKKLDATLEKLAENDGVYTSYG